MDFRKSLGAVRGSDAGGSQGCFFMTLALCTVVITILLAIALSGLGIAKLVIGGIYFHDCELQPLLPIFLIVDACVGLVLGCSRCGGKQDDDSGGNDSLGVQIIKGCASLVAGLFTLAWLICGTIWVVDVRKVIYSPDHCVPPSTPSPTAAAGTGRGSTLLAALTSSTPSGHCVTCNEVLTDFTFVVVIVQWVLTGLVLLMVVAALVKLCCCRSD